MQAYFCQRTPDAPSMHEDPAKPTARVRSVLTAVSCEHPRFAVLGGHGYAGVKTAAPSNLPLRTASKASFA